MFRLVPNLHWIIVEDSRDKLHKQIDKIKIGKREIGDIKIEIVDIKIDNVYIKIEIVDIKIL